MTKFKNLSLEHQAIRVYLLSLVVSVVSYYPFNQLYIWIFKPATFGGDLFFPIPNLVGDAMMGTIFALYLILPLLVFSIIQKKQWLIWIIGAIIPLLMALVNGGKEIFWALLLSAFGWGLAKGILLIKGKK